MARKKDGSLGIYFFIGAAYLFCLIWFVAKPLLAWYLGACDDTISRYGVRTYCGKDVLIEAEVGVVVCALIGLGFYKMIRAIQRVGKGDAGPRERRLWEAAEKGDCPAMRVLLQQGANPNSHIAGDERTIAHRAAKTGQIDVLRVLREHKARLDAADAVGDTPLDEAIAARRLDVVQALFEMGVRAANPALKSQYDPVYKAAYHGSPEIIRLLRGRGCPIEKRMQIYTRKRTFRVTPLHAAAMQGHGECIRALLDLGAHVNRGSVPPLYWAAARGDEKTARQLLAAGGWVTPEVLRAVPQTAQNQELRATLEAAYRENPPSLWNRLFARYAW